VKRKTSKLRAIAHCLAIAGALVVGSLAIPIGTVSAHKSLKLKELKLDPTKGYILVRVGPSAGKGDAPIVVFARMDPRTGTIFGEGKLNALSSKEYNASSAGGGNFVATDGKTSAYVVPVNPGKWVIAGAGASIFSLGTYGFEVKAGEVVDIGTVLTGREDGKSPIPEIAAAKLSPDLVSFGTLMNIVMTDALLLKPPVDGAVPPAPIASWPVRPAVLEADVRFDNVYQGLINRVLGLPPMEHQQKSGATVSVVGSDARGGSTPATPAAEVRSDTGL
jgi:hypothetical protein